MTTGLPADSAEDDARAGVPTQPPAHVPMSALPPALALLHAADRGSRSTTTYRVERWPVVVGRSLSCDWVLDDPHLAAEHLRIEPDGTGGLAVAVLDTDNGVALRHAHHRRGERFAWPPGAELGLGRLHLGVRLAGEPLSPEQPFVRGVRAWLGGASTTALLLAALAAVQLVQGWLSDAEGNVASKLVSAFIGLLLGVAGWALLWSLLSKLFSGKLLFRQHVNIAVSGLLAAEAVTLVAGLVAFSLSWPVLARLEGHLAVSVLCVAVWRHLVLALPIKPARLGWAVATVAVLGVGVKMGLDWQSRQRLTNTLYMSQLFPPAWRLATPVSSEQWLEGARDSLKAGLARRLQSGDDEPAESGGLLD